jgi:hypothetical protein
VLNGVSWSRRRSSASRINRRECDGRVTYCERTSPDDESLHH